MPRALALVLIALAGAAHAQQEPVATTHLGGFASAGASCFSDRAADFVYNVIPEGPGATRRCDGGLDTLVGIQGELALGPELTATLQFSAQRNADRSFAPRASVANLRWSPTDAVDVRVGRVLLPIFLESDYRLVRFALPTIRPPEAVYGLYPNFTVDGVDVARRLALGNWRLHLYAGLQRNNFPDPASGSDEVDWIRVRDTVTLAAQGESGALTVRAAYNRSLVTYTPPALESVFNALRAIDGISPGAAALADELELRDAPFDLLTGAIRYDAHDILVEAEVAARQFHKSFYRNSAGASLVAGYRFGPWMPYGTLEKRITWGTDAADGRAGPLAPYVDAVIASSRLEGGAGGLGLSRELSRAIVAKAEVQWLHRSAGSSAYFLTNQNAAFEAGQAQWYRLYSINLSVAF